jgi:hypothetical protein
VYNEKEIDYPPQLSFFLVGGSIGDCTIDQFVVTAPGNKGSPPICGFNTGQHSN